MVTTIDAKTSFWICGGEIEEEFEQCVPSGKEYMNTCKSQTAGKSTYQLVLGVLARAS